MKTAKSARKSKLEKVARSSRPPSAHGVIRLLLADHKLLRSLMSEVNSHRATPAQRARAFRELERSVKSHVRAEERTFLALLKDHPKFEDAALEGYEEHRVHEYVLAGIHGVRDERRRGEQMHVFCEILEHHLKEEEEKLFPRFRKYAAVATRRKIGRDFLEVRKATNSTASARGAARFAP